MASLFVFAALVERQRKSIRERDEQICQSPIAHKCFGRIEIHHVAPQGFEKRLGVPEYQRDRPENLLSLCQNFHHLVHPDEKEFLEIYHQDPKNARAYIEENRKRLNESGRIYWFQLWDDKLRSAANLRTRIAESSGWRFPYHKKGKGECNER